jgi:hypothetical protein
VRAPGALQVIALGKVNESEVGERRHIRPRQTLQDEATCSGDASMCVSPDRT